MQAIIADNDWVYIDQIIGSIEPMLINWFSARHPRIQFIDTSQQSWDGWYRKFDIKRSRIARPLLQELVKFASKNKIPLDIKDLRKEPRENPYYHDKMLPGITLADYQMEALDNVHPNKNECGIISVVTGGGKCLGKGTPVLMYDGSIKKIEDVIAGDLIMGDDSNPRKVVSTCRGVEPLYRIIQKNGDSYVVNQSHIMSFKKTPRSKGLGHIKVDMPLVEYLSSSKCIKHVLKGYKAKVDFPKQEIPFDPYLLGLWLGDGISADLQFSVGEIDKEIVEYLNHFANKNNLKLVKYPDHREAADIYALRLYEGRSRPKEVPAFSENWLKSSFKKYGLFNNKHIPACFKFNDEKIRLQLLAGFIDSDGYVEINRDTCCIVHRKVDFIDDIVFIARSLGFRVTKSNCIKECTTTSYRGEYWRITISGNINRIPTKLVRKKANKRKMKKDPLVYGISIEALGEGEYFGFELDGPSKRFLLGDFTVTHNTEIMAAITKAYGLPTVIIANQRVVIEQIKERLELRDVVNHKDGIGLFYGGARPNGQTVVVGSIQSLTSPPASLKRKDFSQWKKRNENAGAFQDIVEASGLLLVDECVHPSTLIETNKGLLKASKIIELLKEDQKVLVNTHGQFRKILGYKISKNKKCFKISTKNGSNITTSDNHRFAIFRDRKEQYEYASNLKEGDLLLMSNHYNNTFAIDQKWYLLGLFIGDGHLINNKQIKFGISKDLEFWNHIGEKYVSCFGGHYKNRTNNRGDLVIRIKSPAFVDWIKQFGFCPGKKTGKMHLCDFNIPDKPSAAGLIKGVFDAEGTVYRNNVKISMTDKSMIELLQRCLSYLGIHSSRFYDHKNDKNIKHSGLWTLFISGYYVEKYHSLINTDVPSKKRRIVSIKRRESTIYDPRPYVQFAEKTLKLKPKTISKMLNKHEITKMRHGKDQLDYIRILNFIDQIEILSNYNPANYDDAKEKFDISWKDVADLLDCPISTIYKKKPNDWKKIVDHKKKLMKKWLKIGQEKNILPYYRIVPFKSIEFVGQSNLIDFKVESDPTFHANGFLVHNCDTATDNRYRKLFMKYFKGRYKYGFSGTPFDPAKPVEALILKEHMGSIIYEVSRKAVEAAGRIIPVKAFMVGVGDPADRSDRTAYDIAQRELIIENDDYHKTIKKIVDAFPNDRTMILVDTNNVEDLGKALESKIENSVFIYGKTSSKKRKKAITDFENGDLKCLIGGKILKRGLDIKGGVHNLIICGGGKLYSDFDQKVGRAVRKNDRGMARLFCFYHMDNYYLYKHAKSQLQSILTMGYPVEVIVNGTSISGEDLVKRRFRLPKK